MTSRRVAIIGAGVIGRSTALAISQLFPAWNLTLFSDRPFEKSCSFGPAAIFRLDATADPRNKKWAAATFRHFAKLHRTEPSALTGVKLISGHIQSDDEAVLKSQELMMADIVYNFHWLNSYEMNDLFKNLSRFAIHFTTYAAEGRLYVPWLSSQLAKSPNVKFCIQKVDSLEQLTKSGNFDAVVNCAGIDGGALAGDDTSVFPIRGVAFEVEAGWHKHFNYRNFDTSTIPLNGSTVMLGTIKQANRWDLDITEEDRNEIWQRYLKLHPAFKGSKVVSEWSGLRPGRPTVRLEHSKTVPTNRTTNCHIIHNYGHSSNGFTMSWGCALEVSELLAGLLDSDEK